MKNAKLYRIFTEDVPGANPGAIVGEYFDGFTLLHGTGFWKGEYEPALVIEILTDGNKDDEFKVRYLIEDLKRDLKQEAVLLAVVPAESFTL